MDVVGRNVAVVESWMSAAEDFDVTAGKDFPRVQIANAELFLNMITSKIAEAELFRAAKDFFRRATLPAGARDGARLRCLKMARDRERAGGWMPPLPKKIRGPGEGKSEWGAGRCSGRARGVARFKHEGNGSHLMGVDLFGSRGRRRCPSRLEAPRAVRRTSNLIDVCWLMTKSGPPEKTASAPKKRASNEKWRDAVCWRRLSDCRLHS